ncbi:hypothetical protein AtNW77_Chr4g0299401 [Arabidopsis thaliana]
MRKHSPLPQEQQNPRSFTKFSCDNEDKSFKPFMNSTSSFLQLLMLMLLIATGEPSLRTPLNTEVKLFLLNRLASEKHWVADSMSSKQDSLKAMHGTLFVDLCLVFPRKTQVCY